MKFGRITRRLLVGNSGNRQSVLITWPIATYLDGQSIRDLRYSGLHPRETDRPVTGTGWASEGKTMQLIGIVAVSILVGALMSTMAQAAQKDQACAKAF